MTTILSYVLRDFPGDDVYYEDFNFRAFHVSKILKECGGENEMIGVRSNKWMFPLPDAVHRCAPW